jgi:UDP-N-acetylmuramoyl-tripeptide--D-alanyl-D-alanine ligase
VIALTLAEIAAITDGTLQDVDPAVTVHGKVEFDSRRVVPGDLFLAVAGEHADGADFAAAAVAAGAAAVITARAGLTSAAGQPLPLVVVSDPLAAITALATAVSRRLSATIVGITGSSGKTSTKDLLAQLLGSAGVTVAAPGSFNNELGHPYTVLTADEETDYLVLEKSARGIGHIRHLTEIAQPRIGAVLNVGTAHVGEFGSATAIAQAKGELVEALPSAADGGVAVLNADDPVVLAMAARTTAATLTFGEHRLADVRAENVSLDSLVRASFELVTAAGRAPVSLQVHGEHQIANALAAAAVAIAVGMSVADVAAGLSAAEAQSHWRMEVSQPANGLTVINDAYNANPESMRAALKALAIMARGHRSVAVLGAMAELGEQSNTEHDALGRLIVRYDIAKLIAVGEVARPIAHGAALEGSWNSEAEWVPDTDAAVARLGQFLRPGDVVLVKGSRSAGMQQVALALAQLSLTAPDEDSADFPGDRW